MRFHIISLTIICVVSSCATAQRARLRERVIKIGNLQIGDTVQVNMSDVHVLFDKRDVLGVLEKELNSRYISEATVEKRKVFLMLKSDFAHKVEINQYGGLVTVCEKLFKRGRSIIVDEHGQRMDAIIFKKERMLFGSYKESLTLLDGRELIVTKIRLGE